MSKTPRSMWSLTKRSILVLIAGTLASSPGYAQGFKKFDINPPLACGGAESKGTYKFMQGDADLTIRVHNTGDCPIYLMGATWTFDPGETASFTVPAQKKDETTTVAFTCAKTKKEQDKCAATIERALGKVVLAKDLALGEDCGEFIHLPRHLNRTAKNQTMTIKIMNTGSCPLKLTESKNSPLKDKDNKDIPDLKKKDDKVEQDLTVGPTNGQRDIWVKCEGERNEKCGCTVSMTLKPQP